MVRGRINRAEVLLDNWKAREEKLARFGEANGSTSRELLFERYVFLRDGVWRLGLDAQLQERANVQLLKGALSRMELRLWPNPVLRLWERMKAELLVRPVMIKQLKVMKEQNLLELERFMLERGFGTLVPGLERELDYERNWFGMQMSGELEGNRRIEMVLEMAKDLDGRYHPTLIDATLVESDGTRLGHGFVLGDALDAPMVVNLMQGRAVSVRERDGRGGESEKWMQVHFEKGDSYLRHFHADYGFDAVALLKDFAQLVGKVELADRQLLDELKKGNQVALIAGAPFHKQLLIEADPSTKQLAIRSETGELLSMRALAEQKIGHDRETRNEMGQALGDGLQKVRTVENGVGL